MKKIITAIGNPVLNNALKKEEGFELTKNDIQYQEGILECLEKEKKIDYLILSELLPGNLEIKQFIEKIKFINAEIKIILILEKQNQELENYLFAKGIFHIFYHNQVEIKEIIQLIKNNKDENEEIKKELNELKKMLLKNENKKQNEYYFSKNRKEKLKRDTEKSKENEIKNEIICATGPSGVGKSIFTVNLANSFMGSKNKILMIDFDILNNSLHTILGLKKYPEKIKNKIKNNNLLQELKIEDLIMKINKKIDLISGINLLFDSKYKISSMKIKNIFAKLKENYDVIIVDTSSECFFDYTKEIMKLSNLNVFITEANLIEIEKSKKLLNMYVNEWNIDKNNFNILFNKYDKTSIDYSILKCIFSDFNILGKLSISSKYNFMINQNYKNNYFDKNIKKEYIQIHQKIIKNNKLKENKINNLLKQLFNKI